ncbi:MAG: hypothetical protein OXH75_20750 [Acidobacteria bacterium]|nr:hypothetical protein [Acidobacteriota bacterium]
MNKLLHSVTLLAIACASLAAASGLDPAPPGGEPGAPAQVETEAPPAIPERPFAVPTGPHAIGMTEYRWTDESRPERFTRDPRDVRSVAVRVWYPARDEGEGGALYVDDIAEFGDGEDFVGVTHVRTHATRDATPAPGPFPVVVYSHGGGWTRFTSTYTTEELASHGYVVVSVDHNGFNKTQFLPDGSSVAPDALAFPQPTGDLYSDAVAGWEFLDEHVFPEWNADARFVLNRIETLNADGPFAGRLDLSRVGMYGWSFGGANSIEMSVVDERVKAAIDHDGLLFGVAPTQGTTRPFLLMHSASAVETPPLEDADSIAAFNESMERLTAAVRERAARLKAASTGDWYDVTIAGTNHASFSDLPLFIPGAASPGIEPARGHEIVNALTVAFFDRYLKGADAPLLEDPVSVFKEVEVERRVGS